MESNIEKIIKLILVLIIALAIVLYWLLPKTCLVKHFKINERLFIITNNVGFV